MGNDILKKMLIGAMAAGAAIGVAGTTKPNATENTPIVENMENGYATQEKPVAVIFKKDEKLEELEQEAQLELNKR